MYLMKSYIADFMRDVKGWIIDQEIQVWLIMYDILSRIIHYRRNRSRRSRQQSTGCHRCTNGKRCG